MKKQDLKTGMTVILRDGSVGKVLLNTSKGDVIVFSDVSWMSLDSFNDNMKAIQKHLEELDILEVYDTQRASKYLEFDFIKYYSPVWKREEKAYYLRDKFIYQGTVYNYLNFNKLDKMFFISSRKQIEKNKTKFTDKEIEELEIPIERFEKIEVEE